MHALRARRFAPFITPVDEPLRVPWVGGMSRQALKLMGTPRRRSNQPGERRDPKPAVSAALQTRSKAVGNERNARHYPERRNRANKDLGLLQIVAA